MTVDATRLRVMSAVAHSFRGHARNDGVPSLERVDRRGQAFLYVGAVGGSSLALLETLGSDWSEDGEWLGHEILAHALETGTTFHGKAGEAWLTAGLESGYILPVYRAT